MRNYVGVVLITVLLLVGCTSEKQNTEAQGNIYAKEIDTKALLEQLDEATEANIGLEEQIAQLQEEIEGYKSLQETYNKQQEELALLKKKQLEDSKEDNIKNKPEDSTEDRIEVLKVESVHENSLSYVYIPSDYPCATTNIIGENIDGIVEDGEDILLSGSGGGEYARFQVAGSIYDFRLVSVQWDDETEGLEEVAVLDTIPEVRNQAVIIETYLPCGIPLDKVTWKDSEGNIYEDYLSADGYGFAGHIIYQ